MEFFFAYLIKSSILLAVSVLFFSLLMLKETFHTFNRFLLLAIVVSALLLPAVNFGVDSPLSFLGEKINALVGVADDAPEISFLPSDAMLVLQDSAVDTAPVADVLPAEEPLSPMAIVATIYFCVLLLLLLRKIYMYVQVVMLLGKGRRIYPAICDTAGAKVLVAEKNIMPFSYFNRIVISENDLCECGHEILAHEMAHVRKGHSYDIFLIDIITILQWFNPFAWAIKHFIKDIHEFEADDAVIKSGVDMKMYQLLIIKKAVGARLYSIANSFNHSLTKKRITMLCKEKSNLRHCAKALFLLPVAVVAACTFSSSDKENVQGKVNENVATIGTDVSENVADSIVEVLDVVNKPDILAEYPGGAVALMRYLQKNIKYPKEAQEQNIQGKSYVQFVVKDDGSIDCVNVVRSSGSQLLDDEAVRAVKSLPRWKAAKHNGKEVNSQFTLPVSFRLSGGKADIALSQSSNHSGNGEQSKNTEGEVETSLHFSRSEQTENVQNAVDAVAILDNNAGRPLYIVDGVHLDNYTGSTDKNQIEAITVLPGDKALPIYGDRAKDGAVIITTKKGAADSQKTKIRVNAIVKEGIINIAYNAPNNYFRRKSEYTQSRIPVEAFKYFQEVVCFVRLNVDAKGRTKAVSDQRLNIKYNYSEYCDEAVELRGEYSRLFMEEAVRIVSDVSPLALVGENSLEGGADVIANVRFVCGL